MNEGQFILELNNQFINNNNLTNIEHRLEQYYAQIKEGKEANEIKLELNLDIESNERQDLINYLVHLEGIASLILNGVLHLDTITDLVAYRYFIAVNNPEVQEIELKLYKDYYQGCYKIYDFWERIFKKNNIEFPMNQYSLKKINFEKYKTKL